MNGKIIGGLISGVFGLIMLVTVVPAEFHQTDVINSQVQQVENQVNDKSLPYLSTCMNATSLGDLTTCKSTLTDLQNECNQLNDKLPVCSDPRMNEFFSTVDYKIASVQTQIVSKESDLSKTITQGLDQCSNVNDTASIDSCHSLMIQIKQTCAAYPGLQACEDPRINEILNK